LTTTTLDDDDDITKQNKTKQKNTKKQKNKKKKKRKKNTRRKRGDTHQIDVFKALSALFLMRRYIRHVSRTFNSRREYYYSTHRFEKKTTKKHQRFDERRRLAKTRIAKRRDMFRSIVGARAFASLGNLYSGKKKRREKRKTTAPVTIPRRQQSHKKACFCLRDAGAMATRR
jgi:hypothetical protein